MSFFNLTMVGYQNVYNEHKLKNKDTLPPIPTAKPINSNLKYHELRTKHTRSDKGINLKIIFLPVFFSFE